MSTFCVSDSLFLYVLQPELMDIPIWNAIICLLHFTLACGIKYNGSMKN
jgi:hypothetical protein